MLTLKRIRYTLPCCYVVICSRWRSTTFYYVNHTLCACSQNVVPTKPRQSRSTTLRNTLPGTSSLLACRVQVCLESTTSRYCNTTQSRNYSIASTLSSSYLHYAARSNTQRCHSYRRCEFLHPFSVSTYQHLFPSDWYSCVESASERSH